MRWSLLPLAAALLLLPGCHTLWAGSSSGSGSATYGPDASEAEANVRSAIPAIEAYYADHGAYAGMTVEGLRADYDAGIGDVRIAVAQNTSYCVESGSDDTTYSYRGPTGPLAPAGCDEAPPVQVEEPPAPVAYDAQTAVRASIPAIEVYRSEFGTYAGMTVKKLRRYDYAVPPIEIVRATRKAYCIESTVDGETYSFRGPAGPVAAGHC